MRHAQRVRDIESMVRVGNTAGIAIDDTDEHRAWYLHEVAKYPRLVVVWHGKLMPGIYLIKVRKEPEPQ